MRAVRQALRRPAVAVTVGGLLLGVALAGVVGGRSSAASTPTGWLYVANLRSATVSAIDLESSARVAEWPVAANPHEFAMDGQTLYLSHYRADRVTALALPKGGIARQIITPPRPHGVAVDGTGRVWITTATDGSIHRLSDQEADRRIAVGETPHALVIDPRRDRAYVAVAGAGEVAAVDLAAGAVLARQAVGAVAEAIALSADGRRLAVASAGTNTVTVLDADPLTARLQISTPGRPVRVAFAGSWLLASLTDREAVAVTDSESGEIAALISVGRLPDGIAVDAAQRFAFVANTGDDSVSVIDLERLTMIGALPTGDGPSGIVWVAEAED